MKLLAIETATEACSAALFNEGRCIEHYRLAPQEHNRLLLAMIEAVLAEAGISFAQLDALAFGRGPGSFTGVRIAASVIQGLAFGADLPVVPVSTLAALAQEALDETREDWAYTCIDARMGEVYWGVYRCNGAGYAELVGQEAVLPADLVPFSEESRGIGIGSGWSRYRPQLTERLSGRLAAVLSDRLPRAASVAKLAADALRSGATVSAEQALPVYLRDTVAAKPSPRR